jgi:hypothetical protein
MDKDYKIPNVPDKFQDILKERMKDSYDFLYFGNGDPVYTRNLAREKKNLLRCRKTGDIYAGIIGFLTLGWRNYLSKEELKEVRNIQSFQIEKSRFEKAEKIKFSEWKGEQFYKGDNYYIDLDMFFEEMFEDYGHNFEDWDRYVWPTIPKPYITEKEAWRVYENDIEGLGEDFDWPVHGIEELQYSLDEFVRMNKDNVAFYPDYSKALLIDDEIAEYKKQHEDEEA